MGRSWIVLVFVLNGLAVLCYRFTPSLDGPLHMARSYFLDPSFQEAPPGTQGLIYDLERIEVEPIHWLAWVFMKGMSPARAQTLIVALLVLLTGLACYSLAKAYQQKMGPGILLVLPLTYSVLLVFGFLSFVLAVALSFFALAWWITRKQVQFRDLPILLVWCVALFFVHRGGLFLLAALIAGHEIPAWNSRSWKREQKLLLASLLVAAGIGALLFLSIERVEATTPRSPLLDLLSLRSLLMVDGDGEFWFRVVWGLLLITCLIMGVVRRARSTGPQITDGLWCAGAIFILASLLIRTHGADLFYFSERAQVVGLILLTLWAATMIGDHRWTWIAASVVVLLHIGRTVFFEERSSWTGNKHEAVMEAVDHLTPEDIVFLVFSDPDWLMHHEGAYVIIAHDGYVLSKRDRFWYVRGTSEAEYLRRTIKGTPNEIGWLQELLDDGSAPIQVEILKIGDDSGFVEVDGALMNAILDRYYEPGFNNGYATIFRRTPGPGQDR